MRQGLLLCLLYLAFSCSTVRSNMSKWAIVDGHIESYIKKYLMYTQKISEESIIGSYYLGNMFTGIDLYPDNTCRIRIGAFEIAAANYYGTWEKTNNNVIIITSLAQNPDNKNPTDFRFLPFDSKNLKRYIFYILKEIVTLTSIN